MQLNSKSTDFSFKSIGHVHSCYPEKFGTPRQSGLVSKAHAFLKLYSPFQPEFSLEGLNNFSHLWVIFVFHKNGVGHFHAKVHPPRLNGENIGVFATRSPHRPNPIGLSLVEILSVEKNGVWVSGVDFIEHTPILDIKPYLKNVEAITNAKTGWADNSAVVPEASATKVDIQIYWSEHALKFLTEYTPKADKVAKLSHLRELIEQTLKLDPRPLVYRGYEGENSPYRQSHAVRIYDLDIHFRFSSSREIQIEKIEFFNPTRELDTPYQPDTC
ncbi:MAG: tRNA (N6-threonylcarbamoyladenosine(37)-N6)-methyltransferase TrmO [Bdellovibrionales bacterium RBG_16_40_8]|nr:MAG: tRNA (N6-threonylcarbamoyladenosine(37)-N6)-methyltransferase TrmO [Bdellovibrionales bacterium RBG_16_40_8]